MRVNLVTEPSSFQKINFTSILTVSSILITVFVLGTIYFNSYQKIISMNNEIKGIEKQIQMLQPKKNEYLSLNKKVALLKEKQQQLEANRYYWAELLEEQEYLVTGKMKLLSFTVTDNIIMDGEAADNRNVITYINNLKESDLYDHISILSLNHGDLSTFKVQADISRDVVNNVE
ncbi:MAG: PilN domain-containing protein [Halothermotrichaceae bacterium]